MQRWYTCSQSTISTSESTSKFPSRLSVPVSPESLVRSMTMLPAGTVLWPALVSLCRKARTSARRHAFILPSAVATCYIKGEGTSSVPVFWLGENRSTLVLSTLHHISLGNTCSTTHAGRVTNICFCSFVLSRNDNAVCTALVNCLVSSHTLKTTRLEPTVSTTLRWMSLSWGLRGSTL